MIPQGIQILLLKNIFLITYLEPDILECEVKWALESITTNKASGGDGIPVEFSKFAGILSAALS